MKNICVFDMSNDGHHWFYNYNLMKGLNMYDINYLTANLDLIQKGELFVENIRFKEIPEKKVKRKIRQQINYFFELLICLFYCKKHNVNTLMLIYFDKYLIYFIFLQWLFILFRIDIVATLHWYPNNKIKSKFLKFLNKKVKIVVHTDNVKKQLDQLKVSNVEVINYPVNVNVKDNRDDALKLLNIRDFKKNLLYFGSTRFDKGLDLLLKALNKVENKDKIRIIIAGKEEAFNKEFIQAELSKLDKLENRLYLEYIPEEMVSNYFLAADLVILPYRKYFNGESGILTEALNNGRPIIAPDIIHFKEKIRECGLFYECENVNALANAIDRGIEQIDSLITNAVRNQTTFRKTNSIESFREAYLSLIKLL